MGISVQWLTTTLSNGFPKFKSQDLSFTVSCFEPVACLFLASIFYFSVPGRPTLGYGKTFIKHVGIWLSVQFIISAQLMAGFTINKYKDNDKAGC